MANTLLEPLRELLMAAGLTPNTQKPVLKTTALQAIIELPDDIIWQALTLPHQHRLELGPVFPGYLVKE